MITEIYYTIDNNGDGSVSLHLFESEELAHFHEDSQHEQWGEDCTGVLILEANSQVLCQNITSKDDYLYILIDNAGFIYNSILEDDDLNILYKFIQQFHENRNLPYYNVQFSKDEYYHKNTWYEVVCNDVVIAHIVRRDETSEEDRRQVEYLINRYRIYDY